MRSHFSLEVPCGSPCIQHHGLVAIGRHIFSARRLKRKLLMNVDSLSIVALKVDHCIRRSWETNLIRLIPGA